MRAQHPDAPCPQRDDDHSLQEHQRHLLDIRRQHDKHYAGLHLFHRTGRWKRILSVDASVGIDFDAAMSEIPKLADENSLEKGPKRVLVADDGRNAADILAMFFQLEGMETAVAYDGLDAVRQAELFDPHLVCMDLTMPLMDGYEAARKIREISKDVILVALSGWDGEEERHRAVDAGFEHYMVKPVKPVELRAMLAQCGIA